MGINVQLLFFFWRRLRQISNRTKRRDRYPWRVVMKDQLWFGPTTPMPPLLWAIVSATVGISRLVVLEAIGFSIFTAITLRQKVAPHWPRVGTAAVDRPFVRDIRGAGSDEAIDKRDESDDQFVEAFLDLYENAAVGAET